MRRARQFSSVHATISNKTKAVSVTTNVNTTFRRTLPIRRIDIRQRLSEARRAIDKCPWQIESFRQMRGERFDAERLGRVVPAENKIHAELFCGNNGPVRRFAGDESVDLRVRDPVNLATGSAGDLADHLCFWRIEIT